MFIELLVRWTEIVPSDETQEDYVKKLVEGEDNVQKVNFSFDYSPMVFNLKDVARFNSGKTDNYTTIRMLDGDAYVVKIPYKSFKELWIIYTGNAIKEITENVSNVEHLKNKDFKEEDFTKL